LSEAAEDLVVPGLVLAELDYWCRKLALDTAWLAFMEDVEAGAWRIHWPTGHDLRLARYLQETYADLGIGIVDASIVALTERLGETKLATLDRRHFSVVRPAHVPALQLLPNP
jgi:predicted nucleic acid-binding protein